MGRRAHACPYFASRQLAEQATTDLVFAPYNYLLDPVVCKSMAIDLEGSVVIIDEAHNVEDVSRGAASREMTLHDIRVAEAELTRVRDTFQDDSDRIPHFVAVRTVVSALILWIQDNISNIAAATPSASASSQRFSSPDAEQLTSVLVPIAMRMPVSRIRMLVRKMLILLSLFPPLLSVFFPSHFDFFFSLRLTGDECVCALERLGVTASNLKSLLKSINNCCMKPTDSDKLEPHLTGPAAAALDNLAVVFEFIFSGNMKFVRDYRMVLRRERSSNNGGGGAAASRSRSEVTYVLCFWCLNPAVAFARLASAARSIILTSGTLSPMDSFASELGLPFSVRLEAPHVIDRSQILAHVVSAGPTGQRINCTFKHTDDPSFQDELGAIALSICQRTPAGVLMFFPSYALLDKVAARWRETKLWNELMRVKCVLMEPKGSGAKFDAIMDKYSAANQPKDKGAKAANGKRTKKQSAASAATSTLDDDCMDADGAMDDGAGDGASSQSQRSDRRRDWKGTGRLIDSQTGGLFLAVSRGKISEGIDFADYAARAVIIVGVPFPAAMDSKVQLKKAHNDALKRMLGGANGAGDQLISGSQWYALQAYRSVNQALGRAIRHRYDYGAVFLVDERYADAKVQQSLSKWVQPCLPATTLPFAAIMERTADFFAKWTANPPAPPPAAPGVAPAVGANGTPLSDFANGGMKPMAHFFGQVQQQPSTASQQQASAASSNSSAVARPEGQPHADGNEDAFPDLNSDDDDVQFIPLPPLPKAASKLAIISRPRIQIAYQSDSPDGPSSDAAGAAAGASSSSKPRTSARDLLGYAASSSSADDVPSAAVPSPSPPSMSAAPTHLSLSCRKCGNALAALPIVQRVAAPPYQQQLTASYFVGTVTSAARQLQELPAEDLPVADHVNALVCSAFALEPTAEDSFGWLGYPCVFPSGLPSQHFSSSSQFFNIWVEHDQLCYQPLCCSQCRSFVGAQILVDRRDASPSFEEVCWIGCQLVHITPIARPHADPEDEGQDSQHQVEGAPRVTTVKSEQQLPNPVSPLPQSPLASLSYAGGDAAMSSPPPLESRMDIEACGRSRVSPSLVAPAVPIPAPRSGDKRRGSPAAVESTPLAGASAAPASSPALLVDITNSAVPSRWSSSRSPPPKKHKQVSAAAVIAAAAINSSSSSSSMGGGSAIPTSPPLRPTAAACSSSRECIQVDSDDDFLATPPTVRTPIKSKQESSRAPTVVPAPAARNSPKWTSTHAPKIKKKHAQKSFV